MTGPADPVINRRPRVLLAAPPFSGHLNPLLVLGHGLRGRGFDPVVVTGPTRAALPRRLGFVVEEVSVADPEAFDRISDTAGPVRSNPVLLLRQLSQNLELLPTIEAELLEIAARHRPDLVVADFTAPVAGLVARRIGVPWVTVMPTPFVLETRTGTPAYCGGWLPPQRLPGRLRDAAGRTTTHLFKRFVEFLFARQLRRAGTSVYRPDGSEAAYSPQAILGLGMREVEFPRDWPPGFDLIGPVTRTPESLLAEPPPPPDDLPSGRLVLVTMGTHLPWVKAGLTADLRTLCRAFPDLTFVVSRGRPGAERQTMRQVAGNLVEYDYLPYDDVLPRFEAVIHHGGAGITYSAVTAGKPSLVCPQDYDQFDFAARVTACGAGRRVSRLDSPAAVRAMHDVLALDRAPLERLARAARAYDPVTSTERVLRRLLPDAPGAASRPAPVA